MPRPVRAQCLVERMGGLPGDGELHRWPLLGDPDREWDAWFAAQGGRPPERYVAYFDDSEALHRGAAAGVGVALGKLTRVRLLVEAGQLVLLTGKRLRTGYGHYLVYPPRSADHAGLHALRSWLLEQAADYTAADVGTDAGGEGR